MARSKSAVQEAYTPNEEIIDLWPDITGNEVNGLGETEPGRPRPVFGALMARSPTPTRCSISTIGTRITRASRKRANIATKRRRSHSATLPPNRWKRARRTGPLH